MERLEFDNLVTRRTDDGNNSAAGERELWKALADTSFGTTLSKLSTGGYTGSAEDLRLLIVASSTGASGISIVPTSPAPSGTGIASFTATQAGTYTNYGGVVVNANSFAVISRSAAGVFSISQTALVLTDYQKKSDIATTVLATNTTNSVTGKAVVEHTKKELAVVKKEFLTPVNSNRTRVDTSMSGSGAFATTPTQDIIVYQLIAGGKYTITGTSFDGGLSTLLYGFYATDGFATPISLGYLKPSNTIETIDLEITVPTGGTFLFLSKPDGYEIGLYEKVDIKAKIDKIDKKFLKPMSTSGTRISVALSLSGSNLSSANHSVLTFPVVSGSKYIISGSYTGASSIILYGFYSADSYTAVVSLGKTIGSNVSEVYTVYQEVTAPAGANFLLLSKHILNDLSLNIEVLSLTEKVDKESGKGIIEPAVNSLLSTSQTAPLAASKGKLINDMFTDASFNLGISKNTISGSLLDSNAGSVNDVNYSLLRIQVVPNSKVRVVGSTLGRVASSRVYAFYKSEAFGSGLSSLGTLLPANATVTNIDEYITVPSDATYIFLSVRTGYPLDVYKLVPNVNPSGLREFDIDVIKYNSLVFADKFYNFFDRGAGNYNIVFNTAHDLHEDWNMLDVIGYTFNKFSRMKNTTFATVVAGDMLKGTSLRTDTINRMAGYKEAVDRNSSRMLVALGGHDYGNDMFGAEGQRNHVDYSLTKADQRTHLINPSLSKFKAGEIFISADPNVCYYYAVDAVNKCYYICLDETDFPQTINGSYYFYDKYSTIGHSEIQLRWLVDTLKSVPSQYTVIALTHTAIAEELTGNLENTTVSMFSILQSYKNKTSITIQPTATIITSSIIADFTASNGNIACMLQGHTHGVGNYIYKGLNIVVSSNGGTFQSDAGLTDKDTPVQTCSDFFMINGTLKTISLLRYGRRGMTSTGTKPNVTGDRFIDTPLIF